MWDTVTLKNGRRQPFDGLALLLLSNGLHDSLRTVLVRCQLAGLDLAALLCVSNGRRQIKGLRNGYNHRLMGECASWNILSRRMLACSAVIIIKNTRRA